METSSRVLLVLRRYIKISFSMHLDAYVASLIFFAGLNVLIALIKPMVPMEIKSSTPTLVLSNFFAMYTTRRRLCSIRRDLASFSPSVPKRASVSVSSAAESGAGSTSAPPI